MRFKKPLRKLPKSTKTKIDMNVSVQPQLAFQFSISLEGYEGPLDVLLMLARKQQVDLKQLSIVRLATQYAQFVESAHSLNLELAADYLVMATWLTYLKSQLILPKFTNSKIELNPDEMADSLRFKIVRLAAIRKAADYIHNRSQLGQNFLPCQLMDTNIFKKNSNQDLKEYTLFDLLKAYTQQRHAAIKRNYTIPIRKVWSLKETRDTLSDVLPSLQTPTQLSEIVTLHILNNSGDKEPHSATSSTLNASLELAKDGILEMSQDQHFTPIFLTAKSKINSTHS